MSRNKHLNLFRFFNESEDPLHIENNLSRAFVICLEQEPTFLYLFLKDILQENDFKRVLESTSGQDSVEIDIQCRITDIDISEITQIYAVAMTEREFEPELFNKILPRNAVVDPITDIYISFRDILIIIEVKRTAEDCLAQLKGQLNAILGTIQSEQAIEPLFISFCWKKVIKYCEEINHLHKMMGNNFSYCGEFLQLIENRFNHWIGIKPFALLDIANEADKKLAKRRLLHITKIKQEPFETLEYFDRQGWIVNFKWAKEVLAYFEKDFLKLSIYPGNTKGQGQFIFSKEDPTYWINQKFITVDGFEYKLVYKYHIKFTHFQRFVSGLDLTHDNNKNTEAFKMLYSKRNFYKYTGHLKREKWQEFSDLLDRSLPENFNWKEKCEWQNKFINSQRKYVGVSFGFQVDVAIPFSRLKEMDKETNSQQLAEHLYNIVIQLGKLI